MGRQPGWSVGSRAGYGGVDAEGQPGSGDGDQVVREGLHADALAWDAGTRVSRGEHSQREEDRPRIEDGLQTMELIK